MTTPEKVTISQLPLKGVVTEDTVVAIELADGKTGKAKLATILSLVESLKDGGTINGNLTLTGVLDLAGRVFVANRTPTEWAGFIAKSEAGQAAYYDFQIGDVVWRMLANSTDLQFWRKPDAAGGFIHHFTFGYNGHVWARGYGWLHDHFAQKAPVVEVMRLGAQQFTTISGPLTSIHTSIVPTGCVVTGTNYDGTNTHIYYRPLQMKINGVWITLTEVT